MCLSQRGLLCYAKAMDPRGRLVPSLLFSWGLSGAREQWRREGEVNRLVENTRRERTSGATYEHIPKDKNAGGTQSNSDLVTLLRVSNCVSGATLELSNKVLDRNSRISDPATLD